VGLRARLLLYAIFGVMSGFWLSVAAVLAILASGEPRVLIELAYWPTHLYGMPLNHYADPNLVGPILLNMLGWTALAELVGLIHHSLAAGRRGRAG
jgi:hypothetical protein